MATGNQKPKTVVLYQDLLKYSMITNPLTNVEEPINVNKMKSLNTSRKPAAGSNVLGVGAKLNNSGANFNLVEDNQKNMRNANSVVKTLQSTTKSVLTIETDDKNSTRGS